VWENKIPKLGTKRSVNSVFGAWRVRVLKLKNVHRLVAHCFHIEIQGSTDQKKSMLHKKETV
jgi:hypothetical protein